MYFYTAICIILTSVAIGFANTQHRVAVAHLESENVTGTVLFQETEEGLRVTVNLTGLDWKEGDYGFHVHELGDTSTCLATGAHFNPDDTSHGGRDREHSERHVGDLGNVHFAGAENVVSSFQFVDKAIALRGKNNILGRGLVLHEREDDLGLTDHPDSLSTGNAGARVACAVIGMHAPVEAWYDNASGIIGPSVPLLSMFCLFYFVSILNFN